MLGIKKKDKDFFPPVIERGEEQPNNEEKPKKGDKTWRAKEACTFGGKFVKQGETVFAEKMDNPHFEPVN
jgi:hypothetical protein